MRIRLFSDEDFYIGKFAPDMRRLNYDVIDVLDVGLIGRPDDILLEFAINEKRAFLTFNRRHFVRIHKQYMNMGKDKAKDL